MWYSWITLVVGLLLIAAPYALAFDQRKSTYTAIAAGIIVVAVSVYSLVSHRHVGVNTE